MCTHITVSLGTDGTPQPIFTNNVLISCLFGHSLCLFNIENIASDLPRLPFTLEIVFSIWHLSLVSMLVKVTSSPGVKVIQCISRNCKIKSKREKSFYQ